MDQQKVTLPSIKDVPAEAWQKLSQKKIYFGHQSVGYNIIEGIKDVMKENPQIKLNIVETVNSADFNGPVFAHSPVGKNADAKSKCDAFAGFMNKGLGERVDIAFFKFCYVDVGPTTDVDRIFEDYKSTMAGLRTKYPKAKFIHVTVPVTAVQTGPKVLIKKIVGKTIYGYDENIRRQDFNDRLRKEYVGREPVFDLATLESTYLDGTKATFKKDGKFYSSLVLAYSNDGDHLNDLGRSVVARGLLVLLANLR